MDSHVSLTGTVDSVSGASWDSEGRPSFAVRMSSVDVSIDCHVSGDWALHLHGLLRPGVHATVMGTLSGTPETGVSIHARGVSLATEKGASMSNVSPERARDAALTYLARTGFSLVDGELPAEGFDTPLMVAIDGDDDCLHFIELTVTTSEQKWTDACSEPDPEAQRAVRCSFEKVIARWLPEHDDMENRPVAFSRMAFLVFSEQRAVLRFERNVLSAGA